MPEQTETPGSRPDLRSFDTELRFVRISLPGKTFSGSGRPGSQAVENSPALVEGLSLLSDALDDPITDLQAVLSVLTDDLAAAIPSYLGLTVTLLVQDDSVIVSTLDTGHEEVRASLLLPLLPLGESAVAGSVAFYSGSGGAFIDLAGDAKWFFTLDGPPVLDAHLLPAGIDATGIRGLTALSGLNQALGALIEDGHTPHDAHTELRRRAHRDGQSIPDAARHLLGTPARSEIVTDN